jgi:hypothetical protein
LGMTAATAPASSTEVDVAPTGTLTAAPAQGSTTWIAFDSEASTTGCNAVS